MVQRSDVVYRSALADRLAAQSLTPQQRPILSTGEGLANMGTMLAQALGARNIRKSVDEENAARAQALAKALAGGDANREAQLTEAIGSDPNMLNAAGSAYFSNMLNPKEQFEPITDASGNVIAQRSTKTGQVFADPRAPKPRDSKLMTPEEEAQAIRVAKAKKEGEGVAGPFKGNAMDAQATNILLTGDPSSPTYRAAYAHLAQPKVSIDPQTNMFTTIVPDMSAFRRPAGGEGPAAVPAGSVPAVTAPPMAGASPVSNAPAVAADTAVRLPGGATITQTPGTPPNKFNDTQGKAAVFADRMAAAQGILSQFDKEGTSLVGRNLENIWGGNYLQSENYQKFEQARRDFINAVLRRESGAVISEEEFANADRQYFPQPGDSPGVIRQKAENRRIALEGMQRDAGPSYRPTQAAPRAPTGNIPAPPPGFTIMGQ